MRAPALGLVLVLFSSLVGGVRAGSWEVTSPDQRQTFAYGSEEHRAWVNRGGHLGIVMVFTNDPYVDQVNPRQSDTLSFEFPEVRLGRDGRTFYYQAGKPVAVAVRRLGLFGVALLPASRLEVGMVHGLVRLTLVVSDGGSK